MIINTIINNILKWHVWVCLLEVRLIQTPALMVLQLTSIWLTILSFQLIELIQFWIEFGFLNENYNNKFDSYKIKWSDCVWSITLTDDLILFNLHKLSMNSLNLFQI